MELPADPGALKVLKIVVKNLVGDAMNPKYRRVRLDGTAGEKLKKGGLKVLESMGFVEEATDDGIFLALPDGVEPKDAAKILAAMEPKEEKLSMKAQARRDAEKRRLADLDAARKHREHVKKQIENDKRVRKDDPNWRPGNGVSKGGKDINTFRGKYGEDRGG